MRMAKPRLGLGGGPVAISHEVRRAAHPGHPARNLPPSRSARWTCNTLLASAWPAHLLLICAGLHTDTPVAARLLLYVYGACRRYWHTGGRSGPSSMCARRSTTAAVLASCSAQQSRSTPPLRPPRQPPPPPRAATHCRRRLAVWLVWLVWLARPSPLPGRQYVLEPEAYNHRGTRGT